MNEADLPHNPPLRFIAMKAIGEGGVAVGKANNSLPRLLITISHKFRQTSCPSCLCMIGILFASIGQRRGWAQTLPSWSEQALRRACHQQVSSAPAFFVGEVLANGNYMWLPLD